MKKLLIACPILMLSACATLVDSMDSVMQVGKIETSKSTFDGSTTVSMSPNHLYNPQGGFSSITSMIGAQWNSSQRDSIALVLSDTSTVSSGVSYRLFTGIDFNVDGKVTSYRSTPNRLTSGGYNSVAGTIITKSTSLVVLPLNDLKAIVNSSDCKMRIIWTTGVEVASCNVERIPGGKSTAVLTLKKMFEQIEAVN